MNILTLTETMRAEELGKLILGERDAFIREKAQMLVDNLMESEIVDFFADPYRSCDKAECERNHEFIRYVIPKGVSLDGLTDGKVRLMFSHINSYPRKKLKGKTPLQVFSELYGEENLRRLGLENIDSGSVMLRPELLA